MDGQEKEVTLTFGAKQAQMISHDLSDLLCWWQGYKAGINSNEDLLQHVQYAETGIKAALKINIKLKNELK